MKFKFWEKQKIGPLAYLAKKFNKSKEAPKEKEPVKIDDNTDKIIAARRFGKSQMYNNEHEAKMYELYNSYENQMWSEKKSEVNNLEYTKNILHYKIPSNGLYTIEYSSAFLDYEYQIALKNESSSEQNIKIQVRGDIGWGDWD